MVQKIPREEQLRRELEIIEETIKVRDRLLEEKVHIEATLPRHTIDYHGRDSAHARNFCDIRRAGA